jgi:hypothetical protein
VNAFSIAQYMQGIHAVYRAAIARQAIPAGVGLAHRRSAESQPAT